MVVFGVSKKNINIKALSSKDRESLMPVIAQITHWLAGCFECTPRSADWYQAMLLYSILDHLFTIRVNSCQGHSRPESATAWSDWKPRKEKLPTADTWLWFDQTHKMTSMFKFFCDEQPRVVIRMMSSLRCKWGELCIVRFSSTVVSLGGGWAGWLDVQSEGVWQKDQISALVPSDHGHNIL